MGLLSSLGLSPAKLPPSMTSLGIPAGAPASSQTASSGPAAEKTPANGVDDSPAKAADKAAGPSHSLTIPISLTVPIGKGCKYITVEKMKIEGSLKLAPLEGSGVVDDGSVVELPVDKPVAPGKKFEVDLKKLKELVLGDLKNSSEKAKVDFDTKLECKITTEKANVSIGISVSSGWYRGSTKFVAVSKEKGKDFQFADFDVEPISYYLKPREVEFAGEKGTVSGRLSMTFVLTPAWRAIAAEIGQKVARPVLTAAAEVLTIDAAIASAFILLAGSQIFVFVKSASEWEDVKKCAQAAENGWLSFLSGFCSAYSVGWPDGGVANLRQVGLQAGIEDRKRRLKAARAFHESEGGEWSAKKESEVLATWILRASRDRDGLARQVVTTYRAGIMKRFLAAYEQEHGDDYQFESNFRALKALI